MLDEEFYTLHAKETFMTKSFDIKPVAKKMNLDTSFSNLAPPKPKKVKEES